MFYEEALSRLAGQCTTTEICVDDARKKLERYDLSADERQRIIQRLLDERYIDEQRYARAFVRDKFRFSEWGRVKIAQALYQKHIAPAYIDEAMEEIDDEDYRETLCKLIKAKRRSVKGRSDYEVKGKLARFAIGRGFEPGIVFSVLSINESEEDSFTDNDDME